MTHSRTFRVLFVGTPIIIGVAVAVQILRVHQAEKRFERLCWEVRTPDGETAMHAAIDLRRMGLKAAPAAATLREVLEAPDRANRYGDRSVRAEAALALARIGKPAVRYLIESMSSADWTVRIRSIDTVREIGPDARDAVPALLMALHHDDRDTRVTALGALSAVAETGDEEVIDALTEATHDESISSYAAELLAGIKGHVSRTGKTAASRR